MAKKGKPLDWEAVLAYDVGQFKPNDPESEARLEELLSETTNVYISDKDPKTTVSNLIKLVQICQLQLELKNDDLDDAEEHIKDLENEVSALKQSAGGDSSALGAPDSRALRDDIADLTKRNDALIRDLSRAEESLDSERKAVQQLTMSLREEKTRSMKSEDTIERLTKELHDCRDQLGTQRSRLQSKTIDEDHFRTQIKDKNSEITKYIHEIQALGAHNVKLSNEVEMMAQELEATVIELERNAKEQEEAQNLIMENDKLIDSLQSEREAMKIKLEELSDQLHRRAVKDDRLINQFQGELSRFRSSWEESQQGLVEKESLIDQLKLEIRQLREELADNDAHQLRKQLNEKDEEIQALHQKLEQSYKDFELLSLDWDEIDRVLQQQTVPQKDRPRTPSLQSHHATDLQSKMEGLKQIRTRDLATISKLQEQVEEQERELVDMRARMDIYEQGHYGMREAMREVKTLKLQKNIRDKEIADLTSKVNDLTAQAEDFYEENQQLRARLGTKEKTKIDVSNLKLEKDIELEQTRALNSTLQNEISRLEEERLALKSQLRLQALERGERAVALGLRAEDLEAVEEYAMNLRHGTGAAPAEGKAPIRPVINNEQLEKLAIELERVHVEAYEARQQITSMEDEVARLSRENRSLEDAVKEISETLVKTRNGTRINGHTGADVGSNIEFPLVQNLIYLLEKKIRRELGHGLETLDEASDSIVDMNRTLREELYSTRANLSDVRTKLQQRESDLEQATLDLSYWKERAQCPRQRVLDLPAELGLGTIHDYSAVVEQLIECLLDLKTKDRELDEARQDIAKFEKSYSVLVGKQRLLYRDFHEQREQWRSEAKSLKEKLQGSETEQECLSLKLREMDRLVDSLSKDPESVRADLIEAQRKVSVLSVNEHNLKRRYSAMLEVESILRKESSSLKNEIFRLEKVSRETIMRLYQSKKELQAQAQHLEKELADSVRLSDFLQLQNTMELYKTKTKLLLDKERDWITDRDRRESDSRKVSHQREQIEQLKQKLAETAAKANSLDITVHQIKERSSAGKKELAELMHKIASLEVERDLLKSRAELAEGKCKAIEGARDEMSKRLSTVEALYMDCTEDCLRAKEAEINTRNAFEGGATKEEHEESQRTIRELREKSEHLSRELDQAKEATEMAIRQTTDYAHLHKMDQKEKDIYRATIRELQMCDDDKLVIGKLHHHILALQMSEALAKQRLEAEKDKVIKLESQVLALEKALDEQEKMIYQIRKDERSKCRYLNKCITDFRIKLAGVVLLERHERACESLRSVDHHKRELEQECKSYREVKKDMEDKIIELEMTLSAKGELFETLKHATRMNERIQAWHSKMTRLQISELQKQREIDRLIVERAAASQENAELGSRVAALEEELVGLQVGWMSDWPRCRSRVWVVISWVESISMPVTLGCEMGTLSWSLTDCGASLYSEQA
ncbi:uncharacterized protein BJ171DRAFT_515759 [Polychytrium aggregatum]|uniref:uncharacterized protein n=1 Tax=Polychytrium aggregatum TaxID=110093 RepID=UPI0022FDC55F|nr:uncharacterized protein BJ171DRAFT_515759 [Polychytrium aggregatum]KAI9202124.1 hypothetical protein BJ171DRAFT_515759 [Polychytrium aggregatum]